MASSLDSLVKGLKTEGIDKFENFHNMKKESKNERQLELVCQKGVYPYEWVDGEDKLKHEVLPPITDLYSKLSLKGISEK